MNGSPLISVIIPIFNLKKYLHEAIDSIIGQTIGFDDHIELVLVNDGSTDDSAVICKEYAAVYPENVICVEQENNGVSVARNVGLAIARGKYINFFDGDDIWDNMAFEKAVPFFEEHYEEIDFVACRQRFFEKLNKWHGLDYKFKNGNRIVDIDKEPRCIQLGVTSALFKREAITASRFEESMKFGEDTRFVSEILMGKCRYGLVADAVYNIRKRNSGDSATQGRSSDRASYVNNMQGYYKYVYELCNERYGEVKPYFQYLLLNGLKWRAFGTVAEEANLSQEELREYKETIISLIKGIDDEVICRAINARVERKLDLLSIKHGDISRDVSFSGSIVWYKGRRVGKITGILKLYFTSLEIEGNEAIIKGVFRNSIYFELKGLRIVCNGKGELIDTKKEPELSKVSIEGNCIDEANAFEHRIELSIGVNQITFFAEYGTATIQLIIYSEPNQTRIGRELVLTQEQ